MAEQQKKMIEHLEGEEHGIGGSSGYRAYHEVHVTKDLGAERNQEVKAFIEKNIAEYNGKIEDKHGIPLMLFERKQDAQKFANDLGARLDIPQEHITVKAQKFTR